MFWRELTLIGARLYERADFERAVELLADVEAAFAALDSGTALKVLLDCREGA